MEKNMTDAEKQHVLETAELLVQKEQYELALELLKSMECVMASWMKGKIYSIVANKIYNGFKFQNYRTEELENQYRELLNHAYEHLYKAGCKLPDAGSQIQDRLNPDLWRAIDRVENELARMRPNDGKSKNCEWEEDYDEKEDFQMHQALHIQSMTEELQYWSL